MTYQYLIKQTRLLETAQVYKKIRGVFLPEEKRDGWAIKDRIRNSIKVSSICINHNIGREILNSFYSVDNGTCLCGKFRLSQSSKSWMYKFMKI